MLALLQLLRIATKHIVLDLNKCVIVTVDSREENCKGAIKIGVFISIPEKEFAECYCTTNAHYEHLNINLFFKVR